jgi:josephin
LLDRRTIIVADDDDTSSENETNTVDRLRLNDILFQPIYHEKQQLMRCGLHSLNNLFQVPKLFTYRHLESIVREYDKRRLFNDYRTMWLGNYDLRILIEAIHRHGFHVQQIDIDRGATLSQQPWSEYFGLLINLNGKHWFTIKNLDGVYYNLDSTFRRPVQIGDERQLIEYLRRLVRTTSNVFLFVVSREQ